MSGRHGGPERIGRTLGHAAFAIVSHSARTLACVTAVALSGIPIVVVLGIFLPSSPMPARCLCAAVVALVTGIFWATLYRSGRSARTAARTERA